MIETRGLRPRQAALAVGIPSSSWWDMLEADPELQSDCERAAARFEAAIVGSILKDSVSLKSWRAKLALLQAAAPWWIAPQRVELDATVSGPDVEERLSELTPSELDAEMERLAIEALNRLSDDRLDTILSDRRRRRQAAGTASADWTPAEP